MGVVEAALHRYGGMEPVGEERRPIMSENVFDVLSAVYSVWKQVGTSNADSAYRAAVKLLAPYRKALEGVTQEMFDELFGGANAEHGMAGVFATAAFNLRPLKVLAENKGLGGIGYRLAKGKNLVMLPGSIVGALGFRSESEGNIFNYGDAIELGNSRGGLCVNYKMVAVFILAAGSGTFLDFGGSITMPVMQPDGMVFVTVGTGNSVGTVMRGGVAVKIGGKPSNIGIGMTGGVCFYPNAINGVQYVSPATGGVMISGDAVFKGTPGLESVPVTGHASERVLALVEKLEGLVDNYPVFERFRASPAGLLDAVNGRDWKGMEKQVLAVGKQIEAVVSE